MEYNIEKECSALGGLFQTIVNDMKGSTPIWEDFLAKATKLHSALRATILAAGAFLEAFQKVADMATNTRGQTREIGSALTRLCMRHRSIEGKLKIFTGGILDLLVVPMQEKMEEWKKTVIQLDKDHTKEYKKAKQEIKRASSDTMRLQKKVKKGKMSGALATNANYSGVLHDICNSNHPGKSDAQNRLDNALQDVTDKFILLEEAEKNSVRTALIEERSRFCHFITCLKPVVDAEIGMLTEVTHLQEIVDNLCMQACDPYNLPPASEQVILDLKGSDPNTWSFTVSEQSPPSSPSSLGSRKSSMCSISSINSSSSGSSKSHSPSHHFRNRAASQRPLSCRGHIRNHYSEPVVGGTVRLSSVSSQDSGFTSQDTLFIAKPPSPPSDLARKNSLHESSSGSATESDATTPSPSYPANNTSASTWSNWPELPTTSAGKHDNQLDRPHTISSAYERNHSRPALTAQTFDPPDHLKQSQTAPASPSPYATPCIVPQKGREKIYDTPSKVYDTPKIYDTAKIYDSSKIYDKIYDRPPPVGPKPRGKPVAPPQVPDFNSAQPDQIIPQPVYVNMNELATMAVQKHEERHRMLRLQSQPTPGTVYEDVMQDRSRPQHQQATRRCHRSASMPAKEYSPLSRVIEELNQHTTALRSIPRAPSPSSKRASGDVSEDGETASGAGTAVEESSPSADEATIEAKAPNSMELANAIKELEASTAALQMNYEVPNVKAVPPSEPSEYAALINISSKSDDSAGARNLSSSVSHVPSRSRSVRSFSGWFNKGVPPGSGPVRRGSFGKPPPPIRRSSSISGPSDLPPGALAVAAAAANKAELQQNNVQDGSTGHPRSGSTTPTPDNAPARHRRAMSDISSLKAYHDQVDNVSVGTVETSIGDDELDDDEDMELPPPPPELLYPCEDDLSSSSDSGGTLRRMGSITDSHSDIIQSLNQKFSHSPPQPNQRPVDLGGAVIHRRFSSHSSDEATPTAESPSIGKDNLLSQIQRGVSLRKTESNDRSAPKL